MRAMTDDDEIDDDFLASDEQDVVVYCRLSNHSMGTNQERTSIVELGDSLEEAIEAAGVGEYDGDDFGCGEGRLFFAGKDAEKIVAVIGPILRRHPVGRTATVKIQRGNDEPETVKF
jgi:hypothetical protein